MGELPMNFITQFHNLSGETVKEKHQSLFRLLHQHSSLTENQQELEFITANLEPCNHLEKIFYVDFLIYFQRFNELYENLKNGDDITFSKVSKQTWFFQNIVKDIDGYKFVNDVLPTMSYSLKMKILKKLPVDEKLADEIFDVLHKRYGFFFATVFLSKCTSSKILEIMKNHPIKLTMSQLKIIYNKNPDLVPIYLEERVKHEGNSNFMNYNPIFIYIAQKDPNMFSNLFNKYHFRTTLGHRTTKRYIISQRTNVLSEPEAYLGILNRTSTIRKLGSEVKDLLFKQSPRTFEPYWKAILQHYPKNQQFNIYKSTFNMIFQQKFGENIDDISDDILKIMLDPKEREEIAIRKLERLENENYLKYATSDYCLKEYMDKLSCMRYAERIKFVEIATACCVRNKDMGGLMKVCELVCVRFKNDDSRIRTSFIDALTEDKTIMDKLEEQHWKFIMEILYTATAKREHIYKEDFTRAKYIEYLIKNKKSIKETILKYTDWFHMFDRSRTQNDPKLRKILLIQLVEIGLLKPDPNDEIAAAQYDCKLASVCRSYNVNNPEDTINIFENRRILQSVKEILESKMPFYLDSRIISGVEYMICQKGSSEQIQELKKLYFKVFERFGTMSGTMWFLKHDPKTLQDNFDHFLTNFVSIGNMNPKRVWSFIKKCSYLELDKRTVEFCKLKIIDKEYHHKKKIVKPLSMLSPPTSHLEFIKPYIPTVAKVNLEDDDAKDFYFIQGKLVSLLHLINVPAAVLPVALQFCKGGFLKFAISPLYSCVYKLPENQTKLTIDQLNENKAVSVKKHAMHLTCVIYDVDTVYNCLKNTTVPSLMATFKYFVKNPSKALWELIEVKIYDMEKKDLQILKEVIEMKIPVEYRRKYFETVWNVLDKYENKELKKLFIAKLDSEFMKYCRPDFAYTILKSSIFIFQEGNNFTANLLIHLEDSAKYSVLAQILNKFKEDCWNHKELQRISRHKLNTLIVSIFKIYMDAEECNKAFVCEMSALFKSIFSVSETIEEHILLSSMAFKDETPENCSKLLAELNSMFNQIFGKYAVNKFVNTLKEDVFQYILTTDREKIQLCHSLYKNGKCANDSLLIMMLLPQREPNDIEHFSLYRELITHLSQISDPTVQLMFNFYLK